MMTDPLYAYIPEFRELWIEETLPIGEKQTIPACRVYDRQSFKQGADSMSLSEA